ncbi:MAG: type restriction enzyme subunit [Thermoplasmata archaeon]|jgi:type I restriction enzyme R subunit|nr:type restriction enzyme subunit [Thermoplasmata archaeon]
MRNPLEVEFEEHIEHHLTTQGGYAKLPPGGFDPRLALWPAEFIAWLKESQPRAWAKLEESFQGEASARVIDGLVKAIRDSKNGLLDVLRRGFEFYGQHLALAQFAPASGLNPESRRLYGLNRLAVARQVHQSPGRHDQSLDMVFVLNGIPFATLELKNEATGQGRTHAEAQYARRDARDPIFAFKQRGLVHFAVDTSSVSYATAVRGADTFFLPFNKGFNDGAGNPPVAGKHATSYLWEEVLAHDSVLDLLQRFLHVQRERKEGPDGRAVTKENLVFPRYHQLRSVRRLVAAAASEGAGKTYLVQHSAGSGKSNSIAWLAHRLASLHDASDQKVFDTVIILTDRTVLDSQLQDTVFQFDHEPGVVQKIDERSSQLADALRSGRQIIISTQQKFHYVGELIGQLPARKYAIIVDEAHSGQTGDTSHQVKQVIGDVQEAPPEGLEPWAEAAWYSSKTRGKLHNLSFFAFTATPKHKTLETFGRRGPDGKPAPFDLYSMKQAIEERFILDVLQNYTTWKSYYGVMKVLAEDPELKEKAAKKAVVRFAMLHPTNIGQKVTIIIEHFREHVRNKLEGRARAMVVTDSRLAAKRYKQAFDKYVEEHRIEGIRSLVAFSGTVKDPDEEGAEYTEASMNGFPDTQTAKRFREGDYRVLLVADKYQTGYDEPLLCAMYVDKKLRGVNAVQTLSRLNRRTPGKHAFVLDFANTHQEILGAFQPYYRDARIESATDPQELYRLKTNLLDAQVFGQVDIDDYCRTFFGSREAPHLEHPALVGVLQRCVPAFEGLQEDAKDDFTRALKGYIGLYSFVSTIGHFSDSTLEKLYVFSRALRGYLPIKGEQTKYDLGDSLALEYLRHEPKEEGRIKLHETSAPVAAGPGEGGIPKEQKREMLSKIIRKVNEVLGAEWTEEDKLNIEQWGMDLMERSGTQEAAANNSRDRFELYVRDQLRNIIIDRLDRNQDLGRSILNTPEVYDLLAREYARDLYERLRRAPAAGPG